MTGLDLTLVAGAGAVGALVRHEAITRTLPPLLAVHVLNVLGALLLGVASVALDGRALLVLGGGLLGGMTTFSTWFVLAQDEPPLSAVLAPLAFGVAAAALGRLLWITAGGVA